MHSIVARVVAFSAGLLAHAQRALAVATIGTTDNVEKQLQRVSLQVSCRAVHVIIISFRVFGLTMTIGPLV